MHLHFSHGQACDLLWQACLPCTVVRDCVAGPTTMPKHIHACMHTCMHACIHPYMHARTHACTHKKSRGIKGFTGCAVCGNILRRHHLLQASSIHRPFHILIHYHRSLWSARYYFPDFGAAKSFTHGHVCLHVCTIVRTDRHVYQNVRGDVHTLVYAVCMGCA